MAANQSQKIYNRAKCVTIPFTWVIDHFSNRAKPTLETVLGARDHLLEWKLYLRLSDETPETNQYVTFAIELISFTKDSVEAKLDVWVAVGNTPAKAHYLKCPARMYHLWTSDLRFNHLVLRSTLDNYYGNDPYLPNDTLTIKGEIAAIVDDEMTIDRHEMQQFQTAKPTLADELGRLLKNKLFGDVSLVVGDLYELRAHKYILAARSTVFAAMFSNDMKERSQNIVTITDASYAVIREMLHFIYTDSAPNLRRLAKELLIVADKYSILKLKALCEEMIFSTITETTATSILIFADTHNAAQLKKFTLNYMQCHAAAVTDTRDWSSLAERHPKLLAEALIHWTKAICIQ